MKEKILDESYPMLVYKPPNIDEINSNPILKKKYDLAMQLTKDQKIINLRNKK